jgi:hypothetical protein
MHSFSKFASAIIASCVVSIASAQSTSNRPEAGKRPQLPVGMAAIEPAALDLVKAMTSKLGAAKSIQFNALVQSELLFRGQTNLMSQFGVMAHPARFCLMANNFLLTAPKRIW